MSALRGHELTVAELLHVVVKHGLLQGSLIVSADGVAVSVRGELAPAWPGEGARRRCVKQRGLVVQGGATTFHHV